MKSFLVPFLLFALCINSLHGQSIADSLKAHYPFDHNLRDVTKYGNNLMVNGGISPYVLVSGNDSALSFSGSDRLTSTSVFDATAFTEITISLWIKTSNITTTNDQLILQGANIGFGIGIKPVSGNLFASFDGSTAGSYVTMNSMADGAWHNIVAQSNGSTTSVYVDGVFDGSVVENLFSPSGGADNKIFVGASTFNTRAYTGAINDLRIYNRLLTQNEIDTLFSRSLSVSTTEADILADFSVFPNPSADGHFSLKVDKINPGSSLVIIDLTGREVWRSVIPSAKQYDIDTGLGKGVYIISAIENGNVKISKKFVVQ